MMNGSSKDDAPTSALSKKQKGRLKKLRKRALEVKYGCETSGLSSLSDWAEWQELTLQQASSDTPVVGPSVRLRKQPQPQQQWQKADGCDHQYILWNILTIHALAAGQKRRRDQDTLTPARLPPWCTLHNPSTTQSIAVIEVCLHDSCTWKDMQPHLPLLSRLLDGQDKTKVAVPVETRWFQGNQPKSVSDELLHAHRTKNNKEKNNLQSRVVDDTASSEDALKSVVENLQELVLPRKERKKEGFPIRIENVERRMMDTDRSTRRSDDIVLPSLQAAKEIVQKCSVPIQNGDYIDQNFVATTEILHHSESPRVFAVDCEMVKTADGVELARITLLQLTGLGQTMDEDVSYFVVIDEFVKPYGKVLDFLTKYSGVTDLLLKDVTTRLEQIQAALLSIMDEKDILIGHSLENDLLALRLVHDNIVDTAVVFRAKKGKRKYSLRHLSAALLGKQIQSNHGEDGHCSEEDAAAALNLAVRRAQEGESFRIIEKGDDQLHLLERVTDGPVVCIGPSDWLQQHVTPYPNSAHALTCETISDPNHKAVVAWLTSPTRRAKLVYAKLAGDTKDGNKIVLSKINEFLSDVVERMLSGTLLLVCIQSTHAKAMERSKQRKVCLDPRSSLGWTAEQEADFQCLAGYCRSGMAFWIGDSCLVDSCA